MAATVNQNNLKDKLQNKASQLNEGSGNQSPAPGPKEGQTMGNIIEKMMPTIQEMLPSHIKPERMARLAITLYKDKRLKECNPMSFLGAVLQSVQLGLEPNTSLGESYIIPYKNQATFQIGYRGIIKMAYNTGMYSSIYAHEVYKNDEFRYQLGLNKDIYHVPADMPEGEPVYYYAVYKLMNGGYDFVVWSRNKVMNHAAKYSAGYNSDRKSPWDSDFDGMAKKTVLLQVLKYAPKSIELSDALDKDGTVKKDITDESVRIIDLDEDKGESQDNQWIE